MPKFTKIILIMLAFALPLSASAALVPCDAGKCTFCDLLTMGQRILDFIMKYVLATGATIFLMVGGFNMITAGGDPGKYKKGWDLIKSTLIGIVIALSAWLVVNTILNIVAVDETGQPMNLPWDKIDCKQINPQEVPIE
jgi:hypothetical protein